MKENTAKSVSTVNTKPKPKQKKGRTTKRERKYGKKVDAIPSFITIYKVLKDGVNYHHEDFKSRKDAKEFIKKRRQQEEENNMPPTRYWIREVEQEV